MNRVRLLCCLLALLAPLPFASCAGGGVCTLTFLQGVGEHIAPKTPLNSQADCSGYSRVNNEQAVGPGVVDLCVADAGCTTSAPASTPLCTADPSDTPCARCLAAACCDVINTDCSADAGTSSTAACAEVPLVSVCILIAIADRCAVCKGGT